MSFAAAKPAVIIGLRLRHLHWIAGEEQGVFRAPNGASVHKSAVPPVMLAGCRVEEIALQKSYPERAFNGAAGVRRGQGSRLEERGIIERLDHGVDHVGGAVVFTLFQKFPHLAIFLSTRIVIVGVNNAAASQEHGYPF